MSIYAELNAENIVVNVIIADADFVATQADKNYVLCINGSIGYTYDPVADEFVAPVVEEPAEP